MREKNWQKESMINELRIVIASQWGWVLTGKGHKRNSWDAETILYLHLGGGYVVMWLCRHT